MQFFNFIFKALFGSILRATENKLILEKFVKRCPILLISSNLAFLSPLGQFLTGAKLLLGTHKYEKNVLKRYTCLGFVKMHGCDVMRILRMGVYLHIQLYLCCC